MENEPYIVYRAKCRICNYEQVVVLPAFATLTGDGEVECANCHNMASIPAHSEDADF